MLISSRHICILRSVSTGINIIIPLPQMTQLHSVTPPSPPPKWPLLCSVTSLPKMSSSTQLLLCWLFLIYRCCLHIDWGCFPKQETTTTHSIFSEKTCSSFGVQDKFRGQNFRRTCSRCSEWKYRVHVCPVKPWTEFELWEGVLFWGATEHLMIKFSQPFKKKMIEWCSEK